jgi:fructose/tagatose bisphosphate aldolase
MTSQAVDKLVEQVVFGNMEDKKKAYVKIWSLGQKKGIYPSSINDFYLARGQGKLPLNFTVPAINLRGLTYDVAQTVFKVAVVKKVGALILEIARSEMGYTKQDPYEYAAVIIAAAVKAGFSGPLFIQGDHFQVKLGKTPGQPKEGELEKIKELIRAAIDAGFYNIDIDTSTLVDLTQKTVIKQQKTNFLLTAELAKFVRQLEPRGLTISLGGEIGEVGGKNSTEEELKAYLDGFKESFDSQLVGLSKISIQTGTHHGGVVLANGSLAKVDVDFGTLKKLAQVARTYGLSGTVQHGASTLPEEYFSEFPKSEATEVHLATEFQNIIFNHPAFPKNLLKKMYDWIDKELSSEKGSQQTQQQFHYSLRKKAWGEFKKECWQLSKSIKKPIMNDLAKKFSFLFHSLNVENTQTVVNKFVKPIKITR